jgi:membrane protease YdiL (CAAX protease family)
VRDNYGMVFLAFIRRHSLVIGIALMFLFTWPLHLSGSGVLPIRFPWPMYRFAGFGFAAASILMTGVTLGPRAVITLLKRFLIWRVGWRWYASLLIIPGTYLTAIALHAAWNGITPDFTATTAYGLAFGSWPRLIAFVPVVFLADVLGNGEEIGWRGYALPRLQSRYAALFSGLVMGLIWALWHLALYITRMNPIWFAWYIVGVVAKSVLITWAYNGTRGSLLIATLYHATWNTSGMFLPVATKVSEADIGAFAFVVLTEVAVVAVITILAGPEHLSRAEARQVQD